MLPYLKTYLEGGNFGTWNGGGYWANSNMLLTNRWTTVKGSIPFKVREMNIEQGEDATVLYRKLRRDGWQRNGDNWGTDRRLPGKSYRVARDGDDGWHKKLTPRGPTLDMFFRGYLDHGYSYGFRLREYPDLLDEEVEWATIDFGGNLIVARNGWVCRFSAKDIRRGKPSFSSDLNGLTREGG